MGKERKEIGKWEKGFGGKREELMAAVGLLCFRSETLLNLENQEGQLIKSCCGLTVQ